MAISSWLCISNTQNMVVKIVSPGGRVQLYDRPVLAKEILVRNPRCCVAHPHVFKQPWAVVSPETMLMPGQKFYIVPISAIRKLQKTSLRHSPSLFREMQASQAYDEQVRDAEAFSCWICSNDKAKKEKHRAQKSSNDGCFGCLISAIKIKGMSENKNTETNTSSSSGLSESGSSSGNKKGDGPKRCISFDSWQPILESIREE